MFGPDPPAQYAFGASGSRRLCWAAEPDRRITITDTDGIGVHNEHPLSFSHGPPLAATAGESGWGEAAGPPA